MDPFSFRWFLQTTLYLALAGGVFGLLAAIVRFARPAGARSGQVAVAGVGTVDVPAEPRGASPVAGALSAACLLTCAVAFAVNLAGMFARYFEVRHWPAQTMYEVLPLGTTSGFLSGFLLYFVLGIHRMKGAGRAFGDLFLALIFFGSVFALQYVLGLDPTGRALPPALQSAWFSTHISAYMFGYFTLFIATLGTWLYFCFKFWRGVLDKERALDRRSFWGILAAMVVPALFGRMGLMFGPGLLALAFIPVWWSMRRGDRLAWFDAWEKGGADRFSWLIFVVGFPFLTAGIVQGALWAQEAWALYWGWDSKEVSALISWIFYAVYLHLRYVAGWRGERGMWILFLGGISIFITFQLFGYLPASQSSLHRYTDMDVVPAEGMMEPPKSPTGG